MKLDWMGANALLKRPKKLFALHCVLCLDGPPDVSVVAMELNFIFIY